MDQQLNNSKNDFLWTLLANPANDTRLYAYNLRSLVDDFPQSGILQALLANASDEKNLKQASVYFNSRALFKLINAPASFAVVTDEKIIRLNGSHLNGYHEHEAVVSTEDNSTHENQHTAIGNSIPESSTVEHQPTATEDEQSVFVKNHSAATESETIVLSGDNEPEAHHTAENSIQPEDIQREVVENAVQEEPSAQPADIEIADEAPAIEAAIYHGEPALASENQLHEATPASAEQAEASEVEHMNETESIPVETSEEPVSVMNVMANNQFHESLEPGWNEPEETSAESKTTGDRYQFSEINDEADKLIVGNIAATDFFMFSKAFDENKGQESTASAEAPPTASQALATTNIGHQDVSKYNDEKMPYTFMWWLDKTRKEYAGVHQPYTSPAAVGTNAKLKSSTDELQQQYFENIFHLTSVDELDKHTGPQVFEFGVKPKEQVIIERFIKEEPQIKPQSSDKLDNENKAKKSSEDRDELVTETLAAIYSDQMLYHKAIAAYRKLMLKYPEKSRYFASKIEQLEKKTN